MAIRTRLKLAMYYLRQNDFVQELILQIRQRKIVARSLGAVLNPRGARVLAPELPARQLETSLS